MSASIFRKLSFIFVAVGLICFSGCSVFMAVKQPDYKDLTVLEPGQRRGDVIAELGPPVYTEDKEGQKMDIFAFTQGYGKGNKAARAVFHGAADVFTLGLWEVIGTPAEAIANGKKIKAEVIYDSSDKVVKVNYLSVK